MTVLFQPDIVAAKDPPGFGFWRSGHYFEHQAMITFCAKLTPAVHIPDYDIYAWRDEPEIVAQWLQAHNEIHNALRVPANVTGIDLSLVDFKDEDQWLEWHDDHAQEHLLLRNAFGMT